MMYYSPNTASTTDFNNRNVHYVVDYTPIVEEEEEPRPDPPWIEKFQDNMWSVQWYHNLYQGSPAAWKTSSHFPHDRHRQQRPRDGLRR